MPTGIYNKNRGFRGDFSSSARCQNTIPSKLLLNAQERNLREARPYRTPCRSGFQVNICGNDLTTYFHVYPDQKAWPYGKHDDGNPQLFQGRKTTTNGGFVGVSGSSPRTAQLPPLILKKENDNKTQVNGWRVKSLTWWVGGWHPRSLDRKKNRGTFLHHRYFPILDTQSNVRETER